MKALRQFALVVAVILPLPAPTMVCALPNAHLTPAERACCKQMRRECGEMTMPPSWGCCLMEVPTAATWNVPVQVMPRNAQADWVVIAVSPSAAFLPVQADVADQAHRPTRFIPQSPPSTISILRI